MRLIRVVPVVVGLLFVNGVVATTSSAITPTTCQPELLALRKDTYDARPSFTNDADFTANFNKVIITWPRLTGAQAPPDTYDILADFQNSLTGLAAAAPPKLDPGVAQRLVTGAQDVIDCLTTHNP
ncbi:MAG: hypothetical protein QOH60_2072 [Mycobacterium sp.]|jgi:hypothetical protein|nr:hypothetical protein [Mycobacterium sp.]